MKLRAIERNPLLKFKFQERYARSTLDNETLENQIQGIQRVISTFVSTLNYQTSRLVSIQVA